MKSRPLRMAFGVEPADRAFKLRLARYVGAAEALAAFAAERDPSRSLDLLDLGCRKGRLLRYLEGAGVAGRFRLHGVDLDRPRLARMHGVERWRRVCADLEDGIPFRAATFDAVVCEQVLEHLADPGALVDEGVRVLRPGGILVVGVPIFPPGIRWIRARVVPKLEPLFRRDPGTHVVFYTYADLLSLVARGGGLRVEAARGFRFVSGGPVAFLENTRLFWRLNRRLGARLPALATEVQVVARRI